MSTMSLTKTDGFAPSLFTRLIAWGKARMRRRTFLAMADLDERLLEDIGVTRADIEAASGEDQALIAARTLARHRRAVELSHFRL